MPTSPRGRIVLVLVVALALALRLVGLSWGVPSEEHFFALHPDEFRMLDPVLRSLASGDPSPEDYSYGSLAFDVLYVVGAALAKLGWEPSVRGVYLLARGIAALSGAATVLVVFLLGRRVSGERAGLVAAAVVALAPGHVLHSHFAAVDVPAALLIAAALVVGIDAAERPSVRAALLGGLFTGLAAATKYPSGLVLVAVAFGLLRARAPLGLRVRRVLLAGAASAVVFVACHPWMFTEWETFYGDLGYELFEHPQKGHGLHFQDVGPGWWFLLANNLPFVLTWPLAVASVVGTVLLVRRGRAASVLLVFGALAFGVFSLSKVHFLRYALALLPVLAVGVGDLVGRVRGARAAGALLAVLLLPAAVATGVVVRGLHVEDSRVRAARWMRENVPAGATVGLPGVPSFETPPLVSYEGHPRLDTSPQVARAWFLRRTKAGGERFEFVVCNGWDRERLLAEEPEWFVLGEQTWISFVRTGYPDAAAFLAALDEGWEVAARFDNFAPELRPWLGGRVPPPDWLYAFPRVEVWRRR